MIAWLGGLGLLVKREYFRPESTRLAEAAALVGPNASYYAVTMGGGPVGYVSSTLDTTPTGITIQNNTVLDIAALGDIQSTRIITIINLTRQLRLTSFDAQLVSTAGMRYAVRGQAEGDSVVVVEVDAGGGRPQRQRVRMGRGLVMSELVSLQLAVGGELRPGRTYTLRTFDPMLLQEREVALTVLAESTMIFPDSARFDSVENRWVPARWDTAQSYRVRQSMAGLSIESWIDAQGSIVSATSPIGFTLERTAFEIAVENYRRNRDQGRRLAIGQGTDLIETTAIAANVRLDPEALDVFRVRLGNVALEGFDLSGGRQQLAGDTLTVRREPSPLPGAALRLPVREFRDTAIINALQPEFLVQSDDPRIQALARRIIGRERRADRVAELLTRWVYENLEKRVTVSVPSAIQVMEERSGDCNEHTVLYVALARAVGLPARTAAGVVYLRGRFYYHAWPEVWTGEWVAVDPTFGQVPADAAHLRFTIGGLARQVELARLIGRLELTVVSQ